jgi:hypothetical protein
MSISIMKCFDTLNEKLLSIQSKYGTACWIYYNSLIRELLKELAMVHAPQYAAKKEDVLTNVRQACMIKTSLNCLKPLHKSFNGSQLRAALELQF